LKRVAIALFAISLVAVLAGCSKGTDDVTAQLEKSTSSETSGTVDGWSVSVLVPAKMKAGTPTTARVRAINSSDATQSTVSLIDLEIRDDRDQVVPTGNWQSTQPENQEMAPFSQYEYNSAFTVPKPGIYTISVAGMHDSKGDRIGARFLSQ
jgi:hypothetical protein